MRCTQYQGLSDNANTWLNQNAKKLSYIDKTTRVFPDGREEKLPDKECNILEAKPNGKIASGMFDEDNVSLNEYELNNGKIVEEFVQAEPWSSGPVIFLALKYKDTQGIILESLWTDQEIENA